MRTQTLYKGSFDSLPKVIKQFYIKPHHPLYIKKKSIIILNQTFRIRTQRLVFWSAPLTWSAATKIISYPFFLVYQPCLSHFRGSQCEINSSSNFLSLFKQLVSMKLPVLAFKALQHASSPSSLHPTSWDRLFYPVIIIWITDAPRSLSHIRISCC